MLIVCPELNEHRNSCSLGPFITAYKKIKPTISPVKPYAIFLDDKRPEDIENKVDSLIYMKVAWETKVTG